MESLPAPEDRPSLAEEGTVPGSSAVRPYPAGRHPWQARPSQPGGGGPSLGGPAPSLAGQVSPAIGAGKGSTSTTALNPNHRAPCARHTLASFPFAPFSSALRGRRGKRPCLPLHSPSCCASVVHSHYASVRRSPDCAPLVLMVQCMALWSPVTSLALRFGRGSRKLRATHALRSGARVAPGSAVLPGFPVSSVRLRRAARGHRRKQRACPPGPSSTALPPHPTPEKAQARGLQGPANSAAPFRPVAFAWAILAAVNGSKIPGGIVPPCAQSSLAVTVLQDRASVQGNRLGTPPLREPPVGTAAQGLAS